MNGRRVSSAAVTLTAVLAVAAALLLPAGCAGLDETLLERLDEAFGPPRATAETVRADAEEVDRDAEPAPTTSEDAPEAAAEAEPVEPADVGEERAEAEPEAVAAAGPKTDRKPGAAAEAPPDVRELLEPVVQLNIMSLSLDSFTEFAVSNSGFFESILYAIFRLEGGAYEEDLATVLRSLAAGWDMTITKALLAREEDGSSWWRISMELPFDTMLYETRVSAEAVPLVILYENPETWEVYEYGTFLAGNYREAVAGGWEDVFFADLEEDFRERWEEEWELSFHAPELAGQEEVEVEAGGFSALHIVDRLEWGIRMDYWVSPEVPGGIVRIHETQGEEDPRVIAELTAVEQAGPSAFAEAEVIPIDAYAFVFSEEGPAGDHESEGSVEEPVPVEDIHYGSVGSQDSSYYSYTVSRRSDLYIEVTELARRAELTYYGGDETFAEWVSGSTGTQLYAEDYYLGEGATVYFSVTSFADLASEGLGYTIIIYENPLLSPLGIQWRGEIYMQASEIEPGESVTDTLNRRYLNYYKTEAGPAGRLRIRAEDLPEGTELFWYDAELDAAGGSYQEAYTSYEDSAIQIDVSGLEEGTVCYYYVVADPAAADRSERFTLSVTEVVGPEGE